MLCAIWMDLLLLKWQIYFCRWSESSVITMILIKITESALSSNWYLVYKCIFHNYSLLLINIRLFNERMFIKVHSKPCQSMIWVNQLSINSRIPKKSSLETPFSIFCNKMVIISKFLPICSGSKSVSLWMHWKCAPWEEVDDRPIWKGPLPSPKK